MGLPSYLDKAIISYRCAEKADETNAVVYYNLASALLWKRDISPDAVANYFSKAEVLAPTWPSVRTETIRALLKALKHEINSLKYQQRDTRKEIKEFIKTLRHKAERENLFSDEVSSVSATYNEPHGHKEWIDKLLEIKADQRNKLKESTPRMLQILKRSKLALNEIRFGPLLENPSLKTSPQVPHGREESLDELLATKANQWKMRRVIESRLTEILKRLQTSIHETRFGPYLDSLPSKLDYEGVGVNEIARMIVPPDRIDENDISQLNLWAEVLCSNPAALLNGRQLCAVLERYYPEDFWRNLFMLEQLETKLMKPEGRRYPQLREAGQLRKLCKKTICQAIKQDSQHYATLDWLGTPRIGIKIENQIQILKNIKRESSARRLLLGRAYSSNFEWEHAVKNFKKVVELAENEAEYWAELARAQKMLNQWEDVCVAFGHANKLSEGIDEKYYLTELKLAFNEWGNYLYQLRQYRAAGQKYSQALAVDDSDAVIHSNLALAWEQEIPDPTAIKNAIDALNRAIGLAPENLDYVQRLKRLNCLLESLKFYTPDVMAFMPFVNPIALEVAADLIPLISQEDALTPELQESINDMRTAIRNRYGVNVPGIRVRGNENNLPTGTYIILLMEVPLVSGKVSLDRCLIPCASEKLKAYGVITEDAVDPLTGEAATWIDQRDINKIKDLGYDAYDSIGYICRHLQAVIRRNLADINGVQETSALLESESPDLLQAVRNSRHGLVGLTIVFKALLTEEVPITPIRKVVEEFLKLSIEENNLAALAETVRLLPELKRKLPGTQAGVTLFRLTIPFEETLRKSLYGNNEVPVLAMEPETTQGALQAIRNEVADIAHVAIVVQNPVIRPYLRSLVELEFPHLSVITKDEAPEQFAMAVTEIHYDA
jgi:tetratricopeptide (TPR) repeat protein